MLKKWRCALWAALLTAAVSESFAAGLVAHWKLDETGAPYTDVSASAIVLGLDANTTAPLLAGGASGNGMQTNWQATPGVATRLAAYAATLQNDSFSFSFWINPIGLAPGDNLIGKEMQATAADAAFARLAWQVHVAADNGSGAASLEFLVRGANRAQGNFFGNVVSSATLPLHTAAGRWHHIAGGYDAATGKMSLFVDGVENDATNGKPGAKNSDGGAFVLGSMLNGSTYIAYATIAAFDDVQLFSGLLTGRDVAFLMANPGRDKVATAPVSTAPIALLAAWKMEEAAAPWTDQSGNGFSLNLDPATAAPIVVAGADGQGLELNYNANPGVSTRLYVSGAGVQTNSFGFSFWVNPILMSAGDNLIGKEMAATASGESSTRLAWQVHLGPDNGTGAAPVEFLVRGSDRSQGSLFGNVFSTVTLPLHTASGNWVHVAGGYDAATGRLSLFVNGVETDATNGVAGANNSDGGAFAIGSMVNGASYVAFAATAAIDEVQLYSGPLAASDVAYLIADPANSKAAYASINHSLPRNLAAHWKLDETSSPYADLGPNAISLRLDIGTTPAAPALGADGGAALLSFANPPGVSTRLAAYGAALQTDSFGFSFWVNPQNLSAGQNLIGKEMAPTGSGDSFTRLAWQVHVGPDNGSGQGCLEFLVRGTDRSQGDFFGNVLSGVTLPLGQAVTDWYHVAGGYDAGTGKMSLFVNGVEADSNNGKPGAKNSDGGAFTVGTTINGTSYNQFAALAAIDDMQLYNAPLSVQDVGFLSGNPGWITSQKPFKITAVNGDPDGNTSVTFNSYLNYNYAIDVSADMATYIPLVSTSGTGDSTTVTLSKASIDAALHGTVRSRVFVRVRALQGASYTAAAILPFVHPGAYIPQYHFSLQGANVGDPDGVILYQGTYHIFTWDHAVSSDLVSWTPEGWPMRDNPVDAGFWTGSVVVDLKNTSGFGTTANPPMVALFTLHNDSSGQESVGLAYSTDGLNFYDYANNPVLASNDLLFRDPDVFWNTQTNQWYMTVARSTAQNLHFYSSADLKNWVYRGDFGPLGAHSQIWETPGLVQVPVLNGGQQKKWLLFVGAGTDVVQYFVGNFDGTTFTIDPATNNFLTQGTGLDGIVFENFEENNFADSGWTVTGGAFSNSPTTRSTANQVASGYLGNAMAGSYVNGDFMVGSMLTSRTFTIGKNCINFLIAGGNHPGQTCINLVVNGQVVRSTTGDDSNILKWAGWEVSEYKGQTGQIQIVDNYGGFWGRIYIDQIMFSDLLNNTGREHANWADFGSDFYAPKVIRNYDGTDTAPTWVGWIGSWAYQATRPQPAGWGSGVESLFRNLSVVSTAKGYQLVQQPIPALRKQRGPMVNVRPCTVSGTSNVTAFQPATNTYELEAIFNLRKAGRQFGLNLCVDNAPQRVVVGYDSTSHNIFLDRTQSGYVSFDPSFPNVVTAPYQSPDNYLRLHIFVDQSSIEIFTGDGRCVLTSQIYPDPAGTGVQLFSNGGSTTLRSLKAWPLASALK